MNLVKVKHYVENSFEGRPSFILEMSDGKDYISNGCRFKETTKENLAELKYFFDCKYYIDELFESPSIETEDITNCQEMFYGCESLTEITSEFPNARNCEKMFLWCNNLTEMTSDFPKAKHCSEMFRDINNKSEVFKIKLRRSELLREA